MEKRGEGRRRRPGVVYLIVSLSVSLCLALAIVCLEVTRKNEIAELRERVEFLFAEMAEVRIQLELCHNHTKMILSEEKQRSKPYFDDYYYDSYDDDYDEDEDDEGNNGKGNKTGQGPRGKRSVDYKYKVHITNEKRVPSYNRPVQARIYVEKDSYQSHRAGPGGYIPGVSHRPSRVLSTEPTRSFRTTPRTHYHEQKFKEEQIGNWKTDKALDGGDSAFSHFVGDRTAYERIGIYNCNGSEPYLHPHPIFKGWSPVSWAARTDFILNDALGEVTIPKSGIYYVYAQIYYVDQGDRHGFKILRNNTPEFQCVVTSLTPEHMRHMPHKHEKRNTCYTGGLLYLNAWDTIRIQEMEGRKHTLHERSKSFFGMFRVAK